MLLTAIIIATLPFHPLLGAPQQTMDADTGTRSAMFRGDATHSGVYEGGGPEIIGMQWRYATQGDVTATPVVAFNSVYAGSGDGHFYALDRITGEQKWAFDAKSPIQSSAAVTGDLVVFGARDGTVYALDARTGKLRWKVETGPELAWPWGHESGDVWTASPVVANNTVFIGAGDGVLYAINPQTGTVKWRARTGGRIRTAPAVAYGKVYIGAFDGRVYAFDASTGALAWKFETLGASLFSGEFGFDRRSIQSSPSVANGVVYVGARDGFVYAIDANTGKQRWTYDHKISWINSSPAVADGVVYDGSSDGHFVQALDAANGTELWRTPDLGVVWSSPTIASRYLYWGEGSGIIRVADRATGKVLSTFRAGSQVHSSPVIDGNFLFIGSSDGGLYALRLGDTSDAVQRAVFFDSTYVRISTDPNSRTLATYLVNRKYTQLDAGAVVSFMKDRIADGKPSVIVFAIDYVPDAAATAPYATSIFRSYLDHGGKVVWTGLPPLVWPVEPLKGERQGLNELQWDAPEQLLGVSHRGGIFDQRAVRPTTAGRRWGLDSRWRSGWGIDRAGVSEVLALDDWGLAAAWVRRYSGPEGTGFVRVSSDNPLSVYLAAEYRPAIPATRGARR